MKLMKTEEAVGQILCHDITQIIKGVTKDAVFRKGHIIREEDIPVICEEYDRLAAEMVKRHGTDREFNFFKVVLTICFVLLSFTCGRIADKLAHVSALLCSPN